MLILDSTAKSLEVLLSGVPATQLPWFTNYVDITPSTFVPFSTDGQTNSTTPVTIVSAPGASTQRQVKYISVYNADASNRIVTIRLNNGGTYRIILRAVLLTEEHLEYVDGVGFRILDSTGAFRQATFSAVTAHAALTGLLNDDHVQYQLRSEKNAIDGYAGLDGSAKVPSSYLYLADTAPGVVAVSAGAVGVSTDLAKEDHNHSLSVGSPVSIGTANSDGVSTAAARADHVHSHGNQTVATLHALTSIAGAGFFPKSNLAAVTNPTVSNDNTQGYSIGSLWANTATNVMWIAISVATGAAVWIAITADAVYEAESTATATTTSSTDVLMAAMTLTPPAGSYMVHFSGTGSSSSSSAVTTTSIYASGVQEAASERLLSGNSNAPWTWHSMAFVTVNGAQTIEGRWRRTAGTSTSTRRQLYIFPMV